MTIAEERCLHLTGVGTLVDGDGRQLVSGEREYALDCWRMPSGGREWRGRLDFYGTEAYALRSRQAQPFLVLDDAHRIAVRFVCSSGAFVLVGPLPAWMTEG